MELWPETPPRIITPINFRYLDNLSETPASTKDAFGDRRERKFRESIEIRGKIGYHHKGYAGERISHHIKYSSNLCLLTTRNQDLINQREPLEFEITPR